MSFKLMIVFEYLILAIMCCVAMIVVYVCGAPIWVVVLVCILSMIIMASQKTSKITSGPTQ